MKELRKYYKTLYEPYGALYDPMNTYVHYINLLWGAATGQFPDAGNYYHYWRLEQHESRRDEYENIFVTYH